MMSSDQEIDFPSGNPDERELLLHWLGYLRGAVRRKVGGLSDENARWRPDGLLISLIGIVNHLTHVEWRWIEGGMRGQIDAVACRTVRMGRRHGPPLGPHPFDQRDGTPCGSCRRDAGASRRHYRGV